jgi:hypothetical protein
VAFLKIGLELPGVGAVHARSCPTLRRILNGPVFHGLYVITVPAGFSPVKPRFSTSRSSPVKKNSTGSKYDLNVFTSDIQ